jgi:class 3 adenylate cyclase
VLVGRALLAAGFFSKTERKFARLAAEADAYALGRQEPKFTVAAPVLDDTARGRAAAAATRMVNLGVPDSLAHRLGAFATQAPELDLAHVRPIGLARRWGEGERHVIEACLAAVRAGLLELQWDLLCPNCRGAKVSAPALDRVPTGAHCGTCNIDYGRDFARNVELTFRPAPAIRPIAPGEFCLFGPMTTPHVFVQQTLAPGERRVLPAELPVGPYRLRGLHPGGEALVEHDGGGFPALVAGPEGAIRAGEPARPGEVLIENRRAGEATLVIESRAWIADALLAERVTAMQTFRDLFSHEVLRPGDEVAIANITLMFTDLAGSTALYRRVGDARAYHVVREHFAVLAEAVRANDGCIVKTIGDAVMAAFPDPAGAARAALAIQEGIARLNATLALGPSEGLVVKIGMHGGPCIAVTLNERLDYFGSTVNLAARLGSAAEGGEIVLSQALAADSGVRAALGGRASRADLLSVRGFEAPIACQRLSAETSAARLRQASTACGQSGPSVGRTLRIYS